MTIESWAKRITEFFDYDWNDVTDDHKDKLKNLLVDYSEEILGEAEEQEGKSKSDGLKEVS